MQFGKTIVLAAIFLSNLENATGAEKKADDKQRQLATAAESGELESIGEDIALLKLDDKVYWNRFLQRDASVPSAAPSAEPTSDGDDDDDDDDDGKLSYTSPLSLSIYMYICFVMEAKWMLAIYAWLEEELHDKAILLLQ
jgi:hypothetical protein